MTGYVIREVGEEHQVEIHQVWLKERAQRWSTFTHIHRC